ncbi:MAG: hypothetical protein QXS20_05980 [Candidatus Thorarchaeota archaeon]
MITEGHPFWINPPYTLLTDVLQLEKVEPWKVDVGKLVSSFLAEMRRLGSIDFRVSGSALYSASVIFMRKTKELVELGIVKPEPPVDDTEELLRPLIRPPFRLVNRRVTIDELLAAMDQVLSKGIRHREIPSRRKIVTTVKSIEFKVEPERANVEETISEVYSDLLRILEVDKDVLFVDILVNNSRKEVVRVFFALLHLYARGLIDFWADDEGKIWLKLLPRLPEKDPGLMASQMVGHQTS